MEIVKTQLISSQSDASSNPTYSIDTRDVNNEDTLILQLQHENNLFSAQYTFMGRILRDVDFISFQVLTDGRKKPRIIWFGAQPFVSQVLVKSPDVINDEKLSEKKKMLSGKLYNATDEELSEERLRARNLLFDYNNSRPSQDEGRNEILAKLFGSKGNNTVIERGLHCDYGYNIHVGDNFYANVDCTILDCAEVRIGNNVLFAPKVGIYTATHPVEAELRLRGLEYAEPITIGDNVWLGAGVVVLPGITIGDNAVVGAGTIVTKNVPAGATVVGNPGRNIQM